MSGAKIIVKRKFNLIACLRKMDIVLDGNKIGNVANGKEKTFDISPGEHTVFIKVWSRSTDVKFDLLPNGSIEFESGVSPQFCYLNLPVFIVIIAFIVLQTQKLIPESTGSHSSLPLTVVCIIVASWLTRRNFQPGGTYYLKKITGE